MFGEILSFVKEYFANSVYKIPVLTLVFSFVILVHWREVVRNILSQFPKTFRMIFYVVLIGLFIFLTNFIVWKHTWIYIVTGVTIIMPLLLLLIQYLWIESDFKKVIELSDPRQNDYKEEKALLKIKALPQDRMTAKQKLKYARYKTYILINLGNLRAAETMLEQLGSDKLSSAHYHFLKHVVAFYKGDILQAHEEIIKSTDTKDEKTDPILQIEISINQGISYIAQSNYHAAADHINQAIKEYKKFNISNKYLLNLIYCNYAFNTTRISDNESHKDILAEYKSFLNMECPIDNIDYFNLELEIMRQTNASRKQLEELVQNHSIMLLEGNLPIRNKILIAGSLVRITWSAMLNPEVILKFLSDNISLLDTLQPLERYHICKNLFLMFKDLHGELPDTFSVLRKHINEYFIYKATNDLEERRKTLPEEAITARCHCLAELAGLERKKENYNTDNVLSYLNDAIRLAQDNSLVIEELLFRLDIMDELCAIENWNNTLEPIRKSELIQQQQQIENVLPSLAKHPKRAEIGIRMSFYCLILHNYPKCIEYYHIFEESKLSLKHYAPWLVRYMMVVSFSVRILYFKQTIELIKKSRLALQYSKDANLWFDTFPNHDGILDALLVGRFLGYNNDFPLKYKIWEHPITGKNFVHAWLNFADLALNIDITFEQFTEERNSNQIFFNFDQHPFESNQSITLGNTNHSKGTNKFFLQLINKSDLTKTQFEMFNEIYEIINQHISDGCPSMKSTVELLKLTMLPTPVK